MADDQNRQMGYAEIMAKHRAIVAAQPPYVHNRNPKRIPMHPDPDGPFFENGEMTRSQHNAFPKGKSK